MEANEVVNCWDFKNCPVNRRNGCNAFNKNEGHRCWLVTGTMCGGVEQVDLKTKIHKCRECGFYQMVGEV